MAQSKTTKFSRNDARHWEQRVYQPAFRDAGGTVQKGGHYHVKIQAHGERRGVSLHATTIRSAAKAAKELDSLVRLHGWEKGLKLFRGETPILKNNLTLGEYLADVAATGVIKTRTLRTYTTKVRTIAAFITKPKMPEHPKEQELAKGSRKIQRPKELSKYDYVHGGAALWQSLVDATPLHALSDTNILAWRNEYLKRHKDNPRARASAVKTTNSCVRAGKAIFAAKVLAKLPHVKLPDPIPFSSLDLLEETRSKYRSQITDPDELLAAGADELAMATPETEFQATWADSGGSGSAPAPTPAERIRAELSAFRKREAFKVLVLGLCAGLRRGEIDTLLWSQVDFAANCLWIETTAVHELKADSAGKVPLDPQIIDLIRAWKSEANDEFVVHGCEPRTGADKVTYRANRAHVELIRWLKGKGVTSRNPLHSLRKEFGSIICAQAGIHAASRLLRHANISMTAAVYADHRTIVTAGLGSALGKCHPKLTRML